MDGGEQVHRLRGHGDPLAARATAEQALVERKFEVTWQDEWTGTAVRGSKALNLVAGALAQYFKVGVRLMAAGPGETIVRIDRESSGWTGRSHRRCPDHEEPEFAPG